MRSERSSARSSTKSVKQERDPRADKGKGADLERGEDKVSWSSIASKLRKRIVQESLDEAKSTKKARVQKIKREREVQHEQDGGVDSFGSNLSDPHAILLCNFGARLRPPHICSSHILTSLYRSQNFVHYLYGASLGKISSHNKKSLLSPVVRELDDLSLFRTASPFDRRTTALEWHPTRPTLLAAGSKGGDIFLWDTVNQNINDNFIQGIGPGGSIQAMKFWPWNTDLLLTASIDGRVTVNDFTGKHTQVLSDTFNCIEGPGGNVSGIKFHPFIETAFYMSALDGRLTLQHMIGGHKRVLLDTFTWDYWYCCVDVSAPRKVVLTGDNIGNTLLLSLQGTKLWNFRLHKQKVTHAEFSPGEDWLFCTASTDQTVKMWDIRKVSSRESALHVLKHDKPINSAYFSQTDGCRLLTTDQHSQIRVYCGPEWHLENTINHPHRFFQHITPIKASWHPLQDIVVVGRYPDAQFPGFTQGELRTIDFFDAATGDLVSQLHDPQAPGIVSLNKFNARGDYLVSGMGVNLLLWGRSKEVQERQEALMASAKTSGLDLLGSGRSRGGSRRGNQRGRDSSTDKKTKKQDSEKLKMKLQMKTKTKTKNPR